MLKLKNNLLLIIGLFSGFVQASELSDLNKSLLISASKNEIYKVRHALAAGADVNCSDIDGNTPLIKASENGYKNIVELLLFQTGIAVDRANIIGLTALKNASLNGQTDVVRLLLAAGADANHAKADDYVSPALMIASRKGHADVIRLLIGAGANVNQATTDGWTSLMVASQIGHADVVRLLLDAGANVNHVHAYDGRTALIEASRSGYADVVRLLLAAGANVNHASVYDGKTALKEASLNGHADVVRLLLAAGVDVDQISGAGVDQVFDYSWTALMFASRNGHADIVRLLLGAGADVNICSFNGWTSLKLCIHYYRNIDIVKILIQEARINWHLPEHNIDTLITLANAQGHGEVAAFLQQKKDADARWHGLRMAWIGAVHLASNDHLHDPSVVSDSSSQRRRIGLSS